MIDIPHTNLHDNPAIEFNDFIRSSNKIFQVPFVELDEMVNDPGNKLSLLKVRHEAMPEGLTVEAERRNNLLDVNTTMANKDRMHELITALGKEILPPRVYFSKQDSMGDSLINVKFVDIRKHDTAPEQKNQET